MQCTFLCCPLSKVAPAALFFKTAFLYLPLSWFCLWHLALLQCWDLTRFLGGVPCSSRWASLCWPPLWSGLLSARASRRRLKVSHIYVFWFPTWWLSFQIPATRFCWPLNWWFPHLSHWTSEGFSIAHVTSVYSHWGFILIQQMERRDILS